jgi:hypothetical protein
VLHSGGLSGYRKLMVSCNRYNIKKAFPWKAILELSSNICRCRYDASRRRMNGASRQYTELSIFLWRGGGKYQTKKIFYLDALCVGDDDRTRTLFESGMRQTKDLVIVTVSSDYEYSMQTRLVLRRRSWGSFASAVLWTV